METPACLTIEYSEYGRTVKATANGGERLDVFLAAVSGETRSFIRRLIDEGEASVNGREETKAGYKLKHNDEVELFISLPAATELTAENIPISIVYEDSDIAVIDKPKGMVVHPAPGNESGTLVNSIMFHIKDLSGIGGELRPGIVHRIDKMTSGLIVIAKNDNAHRCLAEQMKTHEAGRIYLALVNGNIKEDRGTVSEPIGRHKTDRKKMAVRQDGRSAVTHYAVLERLNGFTLIAAKLETGRTHQIRVHMAHIKHPLVGDDVYASGKNSFGLDGQALHAARLILRHPTTNEIMTFRAPIPDWFDYALTKAGHDGNLDPNKLLDGVKFNG